MELALNHGLICHIDDADHPKVKDYEWYAIKGRSTYYVVQPPRPKKYPKSIYLHRLIVDAPEHSNVDHVNKNGLDNRRINLRVCNPSQNQANRGTCRRIHMIPYKGVFYHKTSSKPYFAAMIWEGKKFSLGSFKSPKWAAKAYDRFARKVHGEFGRYNFPRPGERGIEKLKFSRPTIRKAA